MPRCRFLIRRTGVPERPGASTSPQVVHTSGYGAPGRLFFSHLTDRCALGARILTLLGDQAQGGTPAMFHGGEDRIFALKLGRIQQLCCHSSDKHGISAHCYLFRFGNCLSAIQREKCRHGKALLSASRYSTLCSGGGRNGDKPEENFQKILEGAL